MKNCQAGVLCFLFAIGVSAGRSTTVFAQAAPEVKKEGKLGVKALAALKGLERREWKVESAGSGDPRTTMGLERREWKVESAGSGDPRTTMGSGEPRTTMVVREGLIHVPESARTMPAPVVFAFHGHGGTMRNAAVMFHYHQVWPEAIVVYLQGLNTPGRLTDPEGKKPGWQHGVGAQGDRDLKFFDAVLASLKSDYKVDEKRIYSTGHSNGGGFTYLLWSQRGDVFAAMGPSAAAGPGQEWTKHLQRLKPKPVMHLAGEKDPLVKYEWQVAGIEALRKLNGCDETGTEWAGGAGSGDPRTTVPRTGVCTLYASQGGTPVVTLIHPGAHNFPAEAPELFVRFFKAHARP